MIIGITGGTGCGKTTALDAIRQLGGLVIDCDALYHSLLNTDREMLCQIAARFPGTVTDNVLDRKKLGEIVFSDETALLDLNLITHGAVKEKVIQLLKGSKNLAAIDAIGLFEGGLAELCDVTVAITAPEEVRIARLMARDGISSHYAAQRIGAQKPQSYFASLCDYVLDNNGTQMQFQKKCLAFFRNLVIIEEKS